MRATINAADILAAPAAAFVFTAAAITGTSAPYQSDTKQRLGSIKGIVTDGVTDNRLRKAFVRLRASPTGTTCPAVTDDTGAFVIESVEPGSYTLENQEIRYPRA